VLLSAQCTDKKVNEVTPALFTAGPDPAAMAALAEATILGHIRQLGLARTKARHLKRLAQRWGLSSGENVTRTETDLNATAPFARSAVSCIPTGGGRCSPARPEGGKPPR
jgi:endonuclease-3